MRGGRGALQGAGAAPPGRYTDVSGFHVSQITGCDKPGFAGQLIDRNNNHANSAGSLVANDASLVVAWPPEGPCEDAQALATICAAVGTDGAGDPGGAGACDALPRGAEPGAEP